MGIIGENSFMSVTRLCVMSAAEYEQMQESASARLSFKKTKTVTSSMATEIPTLSVLMLSGMLV